MDFYLYKDSRSEWRWYLKSSNGNKLADSGEGYQNEADCIHAINLIQRGAASAKLYYH